MLTSKYLNKRGLKNSKNIKLIKTAKKVIIIDSPQNCLNRPARFAPNTFLRPTSFDRRNDLAVDKFIKFKQAIKSNNNAIEENM